MSRARQTKLKQILVDWRRSGRSARRHRQRERLKLKVSNVHHSLLSNLISFLQLLHDYLLIYIDNYLRPSSQSSRDRSEEEGGRQWKARIIRLTARCEETSVECMAVPILCIQDPIMCTNIWSKLQMCNSSCVLDQWRENNQCQCQTELSCSDFHINPPSLNPVTFRSWYHR